MLRAGHVQPVWAGHPWIFPQGIAEVRGAVGHGDEVEVLDAEGHELGTGFFAERSAIAVRLFAGAGEGSFGPALVEQRLRSAIGRRQQLGLPELGARPTNGFRLIHGEGDRLPGFVVDRYGDVLVVQFGTAGMARHAATILDALEAVCAPAAILDRTSRHAAETERFEWAPGVVRGPAPRELRFSERGFSFELPLELGQKTGFYFDQRPLRERVESWARGRRVADVYSYVGAIGLAAARGGASEVVCVDSSGPALEVLDVLARKNELRVETRKLDALEFLAGQDARFDLVVVDPPKLAPRKSARERALRAFRRIASSAVKATAPSGLTVLSSCSQAIGLAELSRALALGARDAGRRATLVERLFQGGDHPVPPAFPEGLYLTTIVAQID